jgi:lipid II:glycine glycyltransferase (peptidoglycan interpeptide bridge formation enzyme)
MKLSASTEGERSEDSSFLQSDFWGDFKAQQGWTPLRLAYEGNAGRGRILILVRRLRGGACFAYAPHGPDAEPAEGERAAFLAELAEAARPFLPKACMFLRFDPPWHAIEEIDGGEGGDRPPTGAEKLRPRVGPPLVRAVADVQPPDTVLVDLRPSEEAMLAAMKSKWRYNVRLAEKKGVVVEAAGIEGIPAFYELYRETARRDRIALHPEGYYSRLFSLAAERGGSGRGGAPDLRLWIARSEGRALAAIITLFSGEEAVYLYGASSDEKRNLMPAYALQWAAMRAAKAAGCSRYDLFGIPPSADPDHPMAGLYRFKTGFGGVIAHRAGSWDYPLARLPYAAFRAAEGLRTWYFKDFKKRLKSRGAKKTNLD